ncbi:MAG: response regulator [bacterium]|nr:response regulator [bacterium]
MIDEQRLKLLIVDDEKMIRENLAMLAVRLGLEFFTAEDGGTALKIFMREQPDLVILDIYMPRMNGIVAMHKMKELDPDCPIILITGFLNYNQLLQNDGVKPDGFIVKPFQLQAITELIQKLGKKRNRANQFSTFAEAVT